MGETYSTMAQQIAKAAITFQERITGHAPGAVSVVLSDDTLVITMHEALTPAERALSATTAGAAKVREFHRHLFNDSVDSLRADIKRITGVDVRESAAEIESATGTMVHAFTSGTMVQLFRLAKSVPSDTWKEPAATSVPL